MKRGSFPHIENIGHRLFIRNEINNRCPLFKRIQFPGTRDGQGIRVAVKVPVLYEDRVGI
jgi:hypothetical protein